MKNTLFGFIRNFLSGGMFLLIPAVLVSHAAPVVRSVSNENEFVVAGTISQFFSDIGGSDNGAGGSLTTGRRAIDWDLIQNNQLGTGNSFAPDYFNTVSPRGMVLSTACTDDSLMVSGNGQTAQALRFGNVNADYTNAFQRFTGQRLFAASVGNCNFVDVSFYVPGTRIPATVSSFGAVFTDVDLPLTSGIRAYGADGKPLGGLIAAPVLNNGLSFVGVTYNGGERIARIRIYGGNASLGNVDGGNDVVAMDDFYFSEPRAMNHQTNDFDGDGTADLTVFRPSNGTWHVLQSGSNTYASLQFGSSGDIVVDGDFDDDSRNDFVVFRPSNGVWYILQTSNSEVRYAQFGLSGDKPVAADYDKDGKTDIAVWRSGVYYIQQSSNNQFKVTQWGMSGDVPVGAAQ